MTFFPSEHSERRWDVTGIENALLDLLVRLQDDHRLTELGLVKGIMKLVDKDEQQAILEGVGNLRPEVQAGGSCANVLRTMSRLGASACYSSAVADDSAGDSFIEGLASNGVESRCATLDQGATGTSVILVSPDGERTMNTHLGVCRDYGPEHVPHEEIAESRMFFTTAYIWDTPNQIAAIESALETARGANCKLAIDLADPFAVERSSDVLLEEFARGFDVAFANAQEARMMTGLQAVEDTARKLGETIAIAVVTDGSNGAVIASDDQLIHIPARRVEVVDTTGAGDCFAAGFLYGLVRSLPLETCGHIATALAADTITHIGVRLSATIEETVAELESGAR